MRQEGREEMKAEAEEGEGRRASSEKKTLIVITTCTIQIDFLHF